VTATRLLKILRVSADHRRTRLLKEEQMLKKLSLADIALTIAKPSALTIEAVFIAARKTVDLKLANGWTLPIASASTS
jgi:hypothetical protein